jgi:hypothetical protein
MTNVTLEQVIATMEQNIRKAHNNGNKYHFIYYADQQCNQLKMLPDPLAGVEAVLRHYRL